MLSLDAALIAAVIILAASATASAIVPSAHVRVVAPSLDLVLDTLTTVVTLSVALLGWVRFRERGAPIAVFQTAAFLVLAITNGFSVALVITGFDRQAGMALAAPGQGPLYDFTVARLIAAALLVLGGLGSLGMRRVEHGSAVVLGSAAAMLLIMALVQVGADRLPPLGSINTTVLSNTVPGAGPLMPAPMPLAAAVQVLAAALFLWAAALSRRLYRREGHVGDGYLAVGLTVAAYAQVDAAAFPSVYTGLVTSGDVLHLAFDVILLLGIQAEARAALSKLRRANDAQARVRAVELQHAALEERARLSRELHDGLAQDMWVAKLKTGRLATLPGLGPEGRALALELEKAIDAGLADAQQAVAAMRLPGEPAGTFSELMARCVDEFADRFGLRAEFSCEQPLPPLSARAQAEALRIAREALSNASRHADATLVRVRAGMEAGRFVIVVGDNGRGFDPGAVSRSAFGLASMRERAALIGGELRIDSRPHDGTRISLSVPVVGAAVPVVAGSR